MRFIKQTLARFLWKVHCKLRPLAERAYRGYLMPPPEPTPAESAPTIHAVLTEAERKRLKSAVSLSFCGDLILLRDMVENARTPQGGYDFSDMFRHVAPYWKSVDLAVGVFEGPLAGEEAGYSNSCLGDGIPLFLNFPDEYAKAVREAGIGLVTTAHNHVLDKGEAAVSRTLSVLEQSGLQHFGSYRNAEERQQVKVVTIKGKRIAFLGFTYGSNRYKDDYFFTPEHCHLTGKLVKPNSPLLEQCKAAVAADFAAAKATKPDLIVAMPHMGREFYHEPDAFQRFWTDFMVEQGADIIMGDHPHCVQPVEWRKRGQDDVLISYCPGNLVSSAIKKDGDASMLVEAYLDPETAKPIAAAVVPLYAYSRAYANKGANYQVRPLYDALQDTGFMATISRSEERRMHEVLSIVTRAALGCTISADQRSRRYFSLAQGGYRRLPVHVPEPWQSKAKTSPLLQRLQQAKHIRFIGDDVTAGSHNGGFGWQEPLTALLPDSVLSFHASAGAMAADTAADAALGNTAADVYVIALGSNDIRFTPETNGGTIARNIAALAEQAVQRAPGAMILLIAPWAAHECDPASPLSATERRARLRDCTAALQQICQEQGYGFSDPNPGIRAALAERFHGYYMLNQAHPNADTGIRLFCEAVLTAYSTPQ